MSFDDVVIRVEQLGKCFNMYDRPRDRLKQLILSPIRAIIGRDPVMYHREYWALRDISFEIKRGQTVGIIGQNGSGKSTLLQIITGLMTPTLGTVDVQGRIAALLELGSGFNPEFTGRENVFLNGGLLGFTHSQMEDKFDSIVAFADIGPHLDQAVKTYSSGMMLRLAFAVQVVVEPEVLIIDEALAVGDSKFQLKCFKHLEKLKSLGTTILFVSHAIEQVRSFCDLGLVLEKGKAIYWGDTKVATTKYFSILFPEENQFLGNQTDSTIAKNDFQNMPVDDTVNNEPYVLRIDPEKLDTHTFGAGGAKFEWLEILGIERPNVFAGGQAITIRCQFSWDVDFIRELIATEGYTKNITLGISVADKKGNYIFGCNGFDKGVAIDCFSMNVDIMEVTFNAPYLLEGDYFISIAIALGHLDQHIQLKWYDCILPVKFKKTEKNVFGIIAIDYRIKLVKHRQPVTQLNILSQINQKLEKVGHE